MVEVQIIKAALDQHLTTQELQDGEDNDDTVKEYLLGLLQDEDAYDDLDGLIDAVQPFMEDNRQAAQNIVDAIVTERQKLATSTTPTTSDAKPQSPNQSHAAMRTVPSAKTAVGSNSNDDNVSSSSEEEEVKEERRQTTTESAKSRSTQRKERQRQKKEKNRGNKNSKKSRRQQNERTEGGNVADTDIREVVERLNQHGMQALNEMDDYASAWSELKDKSGDAAGDGDNSAVVWGGRGYGGRGVNRGKGVYKGKDAVVNQLTLSYGGRELLHETHLIIANGHRYGLMGQNGCGKTTLLKRIATRSVPGWPMHLSVRLVEQEVLGSTRTVLESMNDVKNDTAGGASGSKQRHELEEEIAALEAILDNTEAAEPEILEDATERLSELYDRLDAIDESENGSSDNSSDDQNYNQKFSGVDIRARTILKGLQFKESMLETKGNLLSGGWRMRLALAQALYAEPDILLLDEPTNHLDLSAVLFLQDYLVSKNMTVVVVSHDGHFLDGVCTDMIKFEASCKLRYHVGNYSSFREMEEQAWTRNTRKADAAARKEKKAKEFIQKQRSMANSKHRDDNKQRQAAERQKKLGRIGLFSENGQKFKLLAEGNTKRGGSNRAGHIFSNYTNTRGMTSAFVSNEKVAFGEDQQLLNFKFPAAQPLKGGGVGSMLPVVSIEGGRFRYGAAADNNNDWLLKDMSLNVSYGSRIAIVGKNGSGKSTLLKIICDELNLNGGEIHRHPNLKIAHIAQHHIEHLANYLECTPVDYFMTQHHAKNEQEARQFLGGFGLVGNLALQLIGTLSGGQKARLAFATVMYTQPHLLILGEPTNHLDRDSLESLATAVERFQGPVVVVSHNQDFMSRCAKEMWTVADGTVRVEVADGENVTFHDLFEQYKKRLQNEIQKKKSKKR